MKEPLEEAFEKIIPEASFVVDSSLLRLGGEMWTQIMREAYPGAVYYQTQPFRVYRVNSLKADPAGSSESGIA